MKPNISAVHRLRGVAFHPSPCLVPSRVQGPLAVFVQKRGLMRPVFAFMQDSPALNIRFRMRKARKDYRTVLICADVKKLVETAEELLLDGSLKKKKAFWEIFSKRTIASMHLLKALDMAMIARAFDAHGKDTGVFASMASHLPGLAGNFTGLSLLTLVDIFSRRYRKDAGAFSLLASEVPNVMYELSAEDLIHLLHCFKKGGHADLVLCRRAARKVMARVEDLDLIAVCGASSAFGVHRFRSLPLFSALARRATEHAEELDSRGIFNLLFGFKETETEAPPELLEALEENIIDKIPEFPEWELKVVTAVVSESSARLESLRRHLKAQAPEQPG
uniref:RNA-editing substrate-binding complex 6 protein domain-containing protein n=1 Tax=Chromera velia CCMP2878 TaxID=1169474 RepID=A0A0G4HBQ6_9ALVE|mmetsp:Transcript_16887/g.34287  ORF Transcript_16887/g.34287 Transcript_16887/m.34287 type:complete len:334 (-) Transcript_16887:69-1070(-)|eukprot:Cvel_6163.t1-p1 / transcript=Cvel_6163.t1 / gene=Cvel_6163 / organism=Chromera_velia_CCMP2878 / gene_product=hypothetical protein / transcript_product=hypothetical protein / location=Cvel_scaffold298:70213-73087(+) / protein_length=333 / sequence_SO=supercontig / SO=protein_coding / is_pseudo=false